MLEKLKTGLMRRKPQIAPEDYLRKLRDRGLNDEGELIPDPVPIAPPAGYKRQPSMMELVRDMVRSEELRRAANTAGMETFEEADDFDIPDDPIDMKSGWENDFDPSVKELEAALAETKSQEGQTGVAEGLPSTAPELDPAPPVAPKTQTGGAKPPAA